MLLLKASEVNWERLSPGSWEKTKWKINDTGAYSFTVSFHPGGPNLPSSTVTGRLSPEELQRLRAALAEDWPDQAGEADGNPWEFKMYNASGVVKHRDLGYIGGLEIFCRIASALPSDDTEEVTMEDLEIN